MSKPANSGAATAIRGKINATANAQKAVYETLLGKITDAINVDQAEAFAAISDCDRARFQERTRIRNDIVALFVRAGLI